MSKFATDLAFRVTGVKLSDPMSGFFLIRRDVFNSLVPHLSALGFKILLDLFATSKDPLTFREEPFEFRMRRHGESKLDSQAAWDFLMLLADKRFGRFVPVRFISFGLIGGTGVLVHLLVFYLFHLGLAQGFVASKNLGCRRCDHIKLYAEQYHHLSRPDASWLEMVHGAPDLHCCVFAGPSRRCRHFILSLFQREHVGLDAALFDCSSNRGRHHRFGVELCSFSRLYMARQVLTRTGAMRQLSAWNTAADFISLHTGY